MAELKRQFSEKDIRIAAFDLDGTEAVLLEDKSIETTADGITKANGLLRLCEHLGCGPENIIAFGDSANDLEMLSESGYSVGMGNAESCVKEKVDYITDTVEDDGVATAINKLFSF